MTKAILAGCVFMSNNYYDDSGNKIESNVVVGYQHSDSLSSTFRLTILNSDVPNRTLSQYDGTSRRLQNTGGSADVVFGENGSGNDVWLHGNPVHVTTMKVQLMTMGRVSMPHAQAARNSGM